MLGSILVARCCLQSRRLLLLDMLLLIRHVLWTFSCTVRGIVSGLGMSVLFFLSPECKNKWHLGHMAVYLWRHSPSLPATMRRVYLSPCELHTVWLSVQSVSTFTALKSTGHESFLSTWQRSRTWNTENLNQQLAEHRARCITRT